MDQLMKLASDNGLSESQGKDSLGSAFSFLQSKMGKDDFSKIQAVVPEASKLASDADSKMKAGGAGTGGGGLMGNAMGMLGGAGGGGISGLPQLMGFLGQQGVKPAQASGMLGSLSDFLKQNAGVDASSALGASGGSGGGGIAQQAQGLISAFGK